MVTYNSLHNGQENDMLKFIDFEHMSDAEVLDKIASEYEVAPEKLAEVTILVAAQDEGGYAGASWFLVRDNTTGKLQIVDGGHCSCYGFEGQWEPDDTDVDYLLSNKMYAYPLEANVIRPVLRQMNAEGAL
jgi:hypothetical protein